MERNHSRKWSAHREQAFRSTYSSGVGSRGKKQDPEAVAAILGAILKRSGLQSKLEHYKFVTDWERIVGESIAKRTRPESLEHGILRVRVTDSTWAQELTFHKESLIKRLKSVLPKEVPLREILFLVSGK